MQRTKQDDNKYSAILMFSISAILLFVLIMQLISPLTHPITIDEVAAFGVISLMVGFTTAAGIALMDDHCKEFKNIESKPEKILNDLQELINKHKV